MIEVNTKFKFEDKENNKKKHILKFYIQQLNK